ncbi:hypothetical protein [Aeromonas sp. ASNIH1]|uniref:hypothetical protein n=1 Tax=Aeromonas sp. ASNIH1 TaxID=1636606 RepID=UPI000CDBD899|nr:hypothetical protein [Aeromonas sp. ASNIH1]AUZ80855.1 hypothetical protein C2U37_15275 [Aeromonas sp. ASNIH1]
MELIDLNNSDATTLRKHLLETFGVEKAANTSREKLVAAILEQEQAQGIDRQAGDAASQAAITGQSSTEKRELDKQDKVKIRISRDPLSRGNDDVYASVNGVAYIIKREVVAEVPHSVYQVISQANETRYEQTEDGSLVPRTVPSYPISVVM